MTTKDLDLTPVRLKKILLRMMRFNPQMHRVPRKQLVIADALSRNPVPTTYEEFLQVKEIKLHKSSIQNH